MTVRRSVVNKMAKEDQNKYHEVFKTAIGHIS